MACVDLETATDFADLFEVKDNAVAEREIQAVPDEPRLALRYRNGAFFRLTEITVSDEANVAEDEFRLKLWLTPQEERTISFVVTPHSEQHDEPDRGCRSHLHA